MNEQLYTTYLHESDGSTHLGFRCDMAYAKSVTSTAETPVREQRYAIPESRSHDGAVGREKFDEKNI